MAISKDIHEFAIRWFEKYRDPNTSEHEVEEGFFEECFTLGFEMDCGKSFEAAFPGTNAFNDANALYEINDQIHDVHLLGSAIFSQWRYVTHWAEANLLAPQYRNWFITAFSRLGILTADDGCSSFVDGNCKPDRVDKIIINYHRVTKIIPKVSISDKGEYYTCDYSEQLIIDREIETLEHIQHIGIGCVISRKYYVEEGVTSLLDDLYTDCLFEQNIANDPDVLIDPNESKDYKITVVFQKRPQLVINGTYDKNGLPDSWPKLAQSILEFIRFYGIGEILDPNIYMKAKRKKGEYIFCSVEFDVGYKSYYYLTEDDTLAIGDFVIVPVGYDGRNVIVEIVNIEYFTHDKVPFPLDKVKWIIRKCTEEDFNITTEDNSQENQPFDHLVLCNEETAGVKVNVWAELSEGCLKVSGQDFGEVIELVFGEDEYEYFYDFDLENTDSLFTLLTSEGQNIKEMLVQKFSGMDGCHRLREFCDANGITYMFYSC